MKAIIFDLGQVLVDYDHDRTLSAVADACTCDADGLRRHVGEIGQELSTGALDASDLYNFLAEEEGLDIAYEDFLSRFCAGIARNEDALAYAVELQARAQTTVAVISNTNDGHVSWLDEHVPELKAFDLVIMSNEVGMAKPDEAIFRLALELLDLPASDAIFVDDLASNVQAARALGMAGIVHADWQVTRPALETWLASEPAGDLEGPR